MINRFVPEAVDRYLDTRKGIQWAQAFDLSDDGRRQAAKDFLLSAIDEVDDLHDEVLFEHQVKVL